MFPYAVVPLPDFLESADFLEPISRKSGNVNTKIGKSDSSRISEGPITGKSGSVTVDLEYLCIRIYYLDHNM